MRAGLPMKPDTRIFVGDLVRALRAIGLGDRDSVGRLLGFEWSTVSQGAESRHESEKGFIRVAARESRGVRTARPPRM